MKYYFCVIRMINIKSCDNFLNWKGCEEECCYVLLGVKIGKIFLLFNKVKDVCILNLVFSY